MAAGMWPCMALALHLATTTTLPPFMLPCMYATPPPLPPLHAFPCPVCPFPGRYQTHVHPLPIGSPGQVLVHAAITGALPLLNFASQPGVVSWATGQAP